MSRRRIARLALAGIVGVLLVLGVLHGCGLARAGLVSVHKSSLEQKGYLLIAPYRIDVVPTTEPQAGTVQLVDRAGVTLHTWHTEAPVLVAHLQNDGTLFVSMTPALNHTELPGFGTTGIIQQLDWEGNVLWEHRDPLMTLDFEVLPDNDVAYLRWEKTPNSFAERVRGGFATATTSVWANDLVVVNRNNEEKAVWHMSEYLNPEDYVVDDFVARQEFAHANSFRYVTDNPITHRPVFVVSIRHINKVLILDGEDGDIIWESPDGLFALQHDAMLLPNGNLTVFDNGFARDNVAALLSRAVEVNLQTGTEVWRYDGGASMTGKAQFASSIMGGVQRLSNGNTFITLSTAGKVLEVTPEGEVVWEYLYTKRDTDGESRILYRARLYEAEGTVWASKIDTPTFVSSLFCRSW